MLLAILHINAGFLPQSCQKVNLNFVSPVFPLAQIFVLKTNSNCRSSLLK